MDWVNPHGKKKVAMPTKAGVSVWLIFVMLSARCDKNFGMDGCRLLVKWKISKRLMPSINMTSPIIRLKIKVPVMPS